MTILQSIILGIIQGLTEFLPISSSAHLVIVPYLFGWQIDTSVVFIFDVLIQVGTMISVLTYFWKDLWNIITAVLSGLVDRSPLKTRQSQLGWLILLATIPAGLCGLLVKDLVEAAFNSPTAASFFLLGTAVLMAAAEYFGQRVRDLSEINWKDAIWIGAFQALAIFPGISRSGATISCGMLRNIKRPAAARFSFLMFIPIMLAASVLAVLDLLQLQSIGQYLPILITGFITSAVVGYLSIRWLIRFLSTHTLYGFSIYCTILALMVLLVAYFK